MTVFRLQRSSDDRAIGIFTWFAVHGTSLYNNNTHVAGDNKGVAAWMFEKAMEADDSAADDFVAGFSQANAGDVSPNTLGAWCEDGSGVMCSFEMSTCPSGRTDACKGRGPEFRTLDNGVKSCYEIGRRQFDGAREVYVRHLLLVICGRVIDLVIRTPWTIPPRQSREASRLSTSSRT